MQDAMISKAHEMLSNGEVQRVLAWKQGDFPCYPEPYYFYDVKELHKLQYDQFSSSNLSKYLREATTRPGKTLVFLRPCDSYSFNQLVKENQIIRDKVYIIGIGCDGVVGVEEGMETELLEACKVCTKLEPVVYDEHIKTGQSLRSAAEPQARMKGVEYVETLSADEKAAFWKDHLSICIRCNACRNVCPTCHCKTCVFDNDRYDTRQKVSVSSFEDQMFHIIRAYHVAGRCTDCGQCSRVCPQGVPIHLLNRKFIKEINELYGDYIAGSDSETLNPLTNFNILSDPEPDSTLKGGSL